MQTVGQALGGHVGEGNVGSGCPGHWAAQPPYLIPHSLTLSMQTVGQAAGGQEGIDTVGTG